MDAMSDNCSQYNNQNKVTSRSRVKIARSFSIPVLTSGLPGLPSEGQHPLARRTLFLTGEHAVAITSIVELVNGVDQGGG